MRLGFEHVYVIAPAQEFTTCAFRNVCLWPLVVLTSELAFLASKREGARVATYYVQRPLPLHDCLFAATLWAGVLDLVGRKRGGAFILHLWSP